jgi:hypothetical protein
MPCSRSARRFRRASASASAQTSPAVRAPRSSTRAGWQSRPRACWRMAWTQPSPPSVGAGRTRGSIRDGTLATAGGADVLDLLSAGSPSGAISMRC